MQILIAHFKSFCANLGGQPNAKKPHRKKWVHDIVRTVGAAARICKSSSFILTRVTHGYMDTLRILEILVYGYRILATFGIRIPDT